MKSVSDDLKNAGRIDGLSEYTIFFRLVLPLVRPAMATVAVFTMIPIWNDLWFPLILAPAEATKTVTLGAQVFIGQFVTNWNAVLAALTPRDPAGAGPLPDLLAPAHPRHHRRSREMTGRAPPRRRITGWRRNPRTPACLAGASRPPQARADRTTAHTCALARPADALRGQRLARQVADVPRTCPAHASSRFRASASAQPHPEGSP